MKQKTKKSAAKRFKLTARGKILRRHQGFRHLRSKKGKRWLRRVKKTSQVKETYEKKIKKMLGIK